MGNLKDKKGNSIVQMGGDLFRLALPAASSTVTLLRHLLGVDGTAIWPALIGKKGDVEQRKYRDLIFQGKIPCAETILEWTDNPFLVTHKKRSGELVLAYSSALSPDKKSVGRFGKNEIIAICPSPEELIPKNNDNPVWFRPCLVPLQKDGKSVDLSFAKENPDGTILRGGGAYVFDEFRTPGSWIIRSEPCAFRIDEVLDDDNALEWVVWKGILYLKTNLCSIFPSDILPLVGQL